MSKGKCLLVFVDTLQIERKLKISSKTPKTRFIANYTSLGSVPYASEHNGIKLLVYSDSVNEIGNKIDLLKNDLLFVILHGTKHKDQKVKLQEQFPDVKIITQSHVRGSFYDLELAELINALESETLAQEKVNEIIAKYFPSLTQGQLDFNHSLFHGEFGNIPDDKPANITTEKWELVKSLRALSGPNYHKNPEVIKLLKHLENIMLKEE